MAQWSRICLLTQEKPEMHVRSLGQEDPLEEEMATHSSILACEAPWAEEPTLYDPLLMGRKKLDSAHRQK